MNTRNLLILGAVTVGVVIAASLSGWDDGSSAAAGDAGRLFPELEQIVNDVTVVEVRQGADRVTLRLEDDSWRLAERSGYPVEFERVKETVMKVAALEIEEPKTSKPENYAQLGLEDPGTGTSESTSVILRDKDGKELAGVVLGNSLSRRGGQALFVRRLGEERTFLCRTDRTRIEADPTRWLDREVLKLENDRVKEVRIVHADGEVVEIGRTQDADARFSVKNVPADRMEKYAGVATGLGTSLASLSLDDVRPVDEVDFAGSLIAEVEFACFDGLTVVVTTAELDGKKWARLSALFREPPEAPEDTGEPGDTEVPPPPPAPAGKTPEEVRAEVEQLNARLTPWAFAIPAYKSDALAKRMEDLLQQPPEVPEDVPADDPPDEPVNDDESETGTEGDDPPTGNEGEESGGEGAANEEGGGGR